MTLTADKLAINQRFARAIKQAGLSIRQVEKKLDLTKGFLAWIEDESLGRSTQSNSMAIAIAELCDVDARWLATGDISPAGKAAIVGLERLFEGTRILEADRLKLREFFETTAQPPLIAEVPTCRYCGCNDARACLGGCRWTDDDNTICSACLFGD
jgi:transcriptional regulator with XRE-family HTH domain